MRPASVVLALCRMSEAAAPPAQAKAALGDRITELVSASVLSAAALLTAIASYQADLWDGEQAARYAQAGALRVEASRAALHAGQIQGADLMAFGAWLSAHAENNAELDGYYRQRFRPEFKRVFEEWAAQRPRENPNAASSPFVLPGYSVAELDRAEALEQRANEAYLKGQDANEKGDKFVLATVILANALFFGGINQISQSRRTRLVLLGMSVIFVVLGAIHLATLPLAP